MWLLVGLGNPGTHYAHTRHNAGFMLLDEVVQRYDLRALGSKHHGLCWKGRIGMHDVVALAPQTFMNKSGISVSEAARFYKIPSEHVIICYDELDLVAGKCRVKRGGGNGGHNGLRSIDQHINKDYWRVRLGIDRPMHKSQVTSYVLGRFDEDEYATFARFLHHCASHIPLLLEGEPEKMMTAIAQDGQAA